MTIGDSARRIPGVAAVQGAITGALATEQDLPIAGYDDLGADEVVAKLKGLSQRELRTIDAYERKHKNRATITDKVSKLSADEPWSGYDEQTVGAIKEALSAADAATAKKVRGYERAHKGRTGVIEAAEKAA